MSSLIGFVIAVGLISSIYIAFVSYVIKNATSTVDENTEPKYDSNTTSYRIS